MTELKPCPFCGGEAEFIENMEMWGTEPYNDIICHKGSFGCDKGLLEIYGDIVPKGCLGGVEGYLTAENVIERIKEFEVKKDEN